MVRFLRVVALHTITAAAFCSCVLAQQRVPWQPTPGHRQVPIWPGAAPDTVKYDGPEYSQIADQPHELVAEKPWVSDERVSGLCCKVPLAA